MYRSGLCSSLATLSRGVSLGGDLFGSSGISSFGSSGSSGIFLYKFAQTFSLLKTNFAQNWAA